MQGSLAKKTTVTAETLISFIPLLLTTLQYEISSRYRNPASLTINLLVHVYLL